MTKNDETSGSDDLQGDSAAQGTTSEASVTADASASEVRELTLEEFEAEQSEANLAALRAEVEALGPQDMSYKSFLDEEQDEEDVKRVTIGARIIDSWRDMRHQTRRLIETNPGEHKLIFFIIISDIIFFLSWALKIVVAPNSAVESRVGLEIAYVLIAALMVRTASMYAFSFCLAFGSKPFGGKGTWKETRIGVFWGALVAAPFGFLMAVLTVMMTWLEPYFPVFGEEWIALPPYWISLVPFIWFISQGLAEAQGFVRNSVSFMVMSVFAVIGLLLAMELGVM